MGGFAGGGMGGGGAVVAGYKGGGEDGRDGGNRKFWAIFRRSAPAFSSGEPGFITIILLTPAPAKVHGVSDKMNRIMRIKFFFILLLFIIRLRGY